jgi:hypothetical protein
MLALSAWFSQSSSHRPNSTTQKTDCRDLSPQGLRSERPSKLQNQKVFMPDATFLLYQIPEGVGAAIANHKGPCIRGFGPNPAVALSGLMHSESPLPRNPRSVAHAEAWSTQTKG